RRVLKPHKTATSPENPGSRAQRNKIIMGPNLSGPRINIKTTSRGSMAKPYIVITGVKTMRPPLYLVNLPHNCTEKELAEWVESRGFQIASVRIIRDLVAGVSPAFAYIDLQDS